MKNRTGQTLIEVVVATMVAAMTATAVFSVVVSSRVSEVKSDKREAAAMAIKAAQDNLKAFVSADPSNALWSPNYGGGAGVWPGVSGGWALAAGGPYNASHLLTGMDQLAGAQLTYTVADVNCGLGVGAIGQNACKSVTFTLTYPD